MPDLPADPARPWLDSMVVCARVDEAEAVRRLLRERGLTPRAVPSGRARLAWTVIDGDHIHGLVVSGVGAEAAHRSATFWMHRTRRLAVLGVTAGTGLTPLPVTVVEGDERLVTRARSCPRERDDPETVASHVAAAALGARSEEARRSLADAGIAAVLPEVDVWREAAGQVGAACLVVAGLHEPPAAAPSALDRVPAGAAAPGVMRSLGTALRSADRSAARTLAAIRQAAALPAARCALGALGIVG